MISVNNLSSNKSSLILLIAFIALGAGFVGVASQRSNPGPIRNEIPKENQTDLKDDTSSVNTIIYGEMGEDSTSISAVNDSGINDSPVTMLESGIKFVSPLADGKHIFYIADTDYGDVGGAFGLKDIVSGTGDSDGSTRKIYTPEDDYKIDRYILSEDSKWVTWYEIKAPDQSGYTHSNDYYRVFKANLDDAVKGNAELKPTRLSDQKAGPGTQIVLPSIITNSGQVYFDSIIPSSYALYYGFKDEALNTVLPLNTYNSNPYLFNQRYLLFSAYDSNNSKLPSTTDTDSTRDQIVNTNIVKTYDLESKNIVTVAPGDQGEQYKHPVYVSGSPDGEMEIVAEVYKIDASTHSLAFSEIQLIQKSKDGKFTKKTIVSKAENSLRILSVGKLPSGDMTVLVGNEIEFRGNLGTGNGIGPSGYKNKLSSIKVYNLASNSLVSTITPTKSNSFEFISIMPKLPQEKIGIQRNKKLVDELSTMTRQLKLGTFVPVEPKRVRKNPRSECESEWEKKGYPNYEACEACPIYVYSSTKQKVGISPITPISKESAVPNLSNNSWDFEANRNGDLSFAQGTYKRIDYDFPRGSVTAPSSGVVLAQKDMRSGIAEYAYNLGFNTREVEDIVSFFSEELSGSSYVFFSSLSQEEVKSLLSFQVSPQPKALMSQIFYAKKFNSSSKIVATKPQFKPFTRKDFTVVAWGSVIE